MGETLIFGHRGSKGTHPENTLLAFEQACQAGVEGLELDVHLTKDNELVVIHDETIDRTTNGTGYIKDLTTHELQAYSAGRPFKSYPLYTSSWDEERVPTLAEVFERVAGYPVQINIELKTYSIDYPEIEEKTVALVHEHQLQSRVIYSSFNLSSVQKVKAVDSEANVAYLSLEPFSSVKHLMTHYNFSALHLSQALLEDEVSEANFNATPIRVWTINSVAQIKKALALNLEGIITDYPEMALELKKEHLKSIGALT
ncbi:glycerophosphoryl diester phosphodiesterase [Pullulanibacillus camelliae]|uniref:Glycerophosphoryl diester phosphodiesterase n=1 Tax=Pullulanibacillus camelliae TaxID=1707096 RepID=A0A8J2VKC5_9BACL|nr:glycerophosphodiester phosphodiesterase [Pullulanibacillus camelliae]GGE29894.1 glycerophosphoryl diester phosphodiesterase [Pullulanibacillus camelliae]